MYRILGREWPGWLVDRLDWATLVSTLNGHFHMEFEMRAAEDESLTQKQGDKELVRDFIAQLTSLALGAAVRRSAGLAEKRKAAEISDGPPHSR